MTWVQALLPLRWKLPRVQLLPTISTVHRIVVWKKPADHSASALSSFASPTQRASVIPNTASLKSVSELSYPAVSGSRTPPLPPTTLPSTAITSGDSFRTVIWIFGSTAAHDRFNSYVQRSRQSHLKPHSIRTLGKILCLLKASFGLGSYRHKD